MADEQPTQQPSAAAGASLAEVLRTHIPCLRNAAVADAPNAELRTAQSLAVLVQVLARMEQTLMSQLELLTREDPGIRSLFDTLQGQGLLSVEAALRATLSSPQSQSARLNQYGDLLLRWWSAVFAGLQTAVMEAPHEIEHGLNPAHWQVEKKRWTSEESALWNHFKHVIRPELPLKVGDRIKVLQASKTLDAYAALGPSRPTREAGS